MEWYIWQCVKKYLGQLPAKFAVAEADGLKEDNPTENTEVLQKGAAAQSSAETVSAMANVTAVAPAADLAADSPNAAETETVSEGIAATLQNRTAAAVTAEDNTEQSQVRQALFAQSDGQQNCRKEENQIYLQNGQDTVFDPSAQVKSAETEQQTKQEVLPETPPDVCIPELSSYSAVLNEELSRFLNADIDSPASGIINIGAQSVKENFFEDTPQNNFKNNNTESFIPQEPQTGNNAALPEKEDKSA